ncbi:MAG: GntR family transcriptional regulator [Actinomycetaceae bacterium]|nr:GntR family transcriptional regulator [Actinomycetaceae bacterium]
MDFDPSRPIWTQLLEDFQRRVIANIWPQGTRIPSVRELAAEYGTNPNTVQRALAEFERLGLARSERTAGRFVTDNKDLIEELKESSAMEAALGYAQNAKSLGLSQAKAIDLLKQAWLKEEK